MLIPDPRRTPLPNLISHNGVILYQWEFLRDRPGGGEGLPWIAMGSHDTWYSTHDVAFAFLSPWQDGTALPGAGTTFPHSRTALDRAIDAW